MLNDINKNTLHCGSNSSMQYSFYILGMIDDITEGRDQSHIAFQCTCGTLGTMVKNRMQEYTHDQNLKCYQCGGYAINLNVPIANNNIKKGLKELERLLNKAKADYAGEVYFFTYNTLRHELLYQMNAIVQSIDLIYDMFLRNEVDYLLHKFKLGQFTVNTKRHQQGQAIFSLTLINHIIEISPIYDIILSLLKIAHGEFKLHDPKTHSIDINLGVRIVGLNEADELIDGAVKGKTKIIKEYLVQNHRQDLLRIIKHSFDHDLRNIYSHSEYEFTEEGIYSRKRKRKISYNELNTKADALRYIVLYVTKFIEQQRKNFIDAGIYNGAGYKLTPIIKDDGIAIKVEF